MRSAWIGAMQLDMVQPVEGEGIFEESLQRRGEGMISLAFSVGDLEKETANLVKKGVAIALSGSCGGSPSGGGAFAYLDTREDGGDALIQLIQR
jgi:hypothetical protein